MSKLKQRYLKEVKSFFPIMGKPERRHLKKLSEQINDYCLEKEVFSIDDLYQDFGRPSEISNTYFSNIDINDFVKRINRCIGRKIRNRLKIFSEKDLLLAVQRNPANIQITVFFFHTVCMASAKGKQNDIFAQPGILPQKIVRSIRYGSFDLFYIHIIPPLFLKNDLFL